MPRKQQQQPAQRQQRRQLKPMFAVAEEEEEEEVQQVCSCCYRSWCCVDRSTFKTTVAVAALRSYLREQLSACASSKICALALLFHST